MLHWIERSILREDEMSSESASLQILTQTGRWFAGGERHYYTSMISGSISFTIVGEIAMAEYDLPLKGRCLCGDVQFETSEEPADVMYCHCSMCQRWSSGAMTITAKFPGNAVSFTKGRPKVHKTSEKGRRGFCGTCGSHLTFQYLTSDPGVGTDLVLETDMVYISVGAFDNTEDLQPRQHYCVDSQLSWLSIEDGLPRRGYGDEHISN